MCCFNNRLLISLYLFLQLHVNFGMRISLENEVVSTATALKEQCANIIQTSLTTKTDISTIQGLPAITSPSCTSGTFDTSSSIPSYQYDCLGYRHFMYINGNERRCCKFYIAQIFYFLLKGKYTCKQCCLSIVFRFLEAG